MNVTELASILGISKSAVSQMLGRLKAKHLVIQENLPGAGRDTTVNLTDQGWTAWKAHADGHARLYTAIDANLESLDQTTKTKLLGLLGTLEGQLKEWIEEKEDRRA